MKVLLYRGEGFLPWLIKKQTRSQYSHVAITHKGRLIEAREGIGVQERMFWMDDTMDVFEVETTEEQDQIIMKFLREQVGKKYDYRSVFRFVTRVDARINDKWFCSELIFAAFLEAGINLLERIEAHHVSPALLPLSPLLRPAN